MKSENFGKNLKELLKQLDMTQAELSARAKLGPAAISMIVSGAREPGLSTIVKILNVIPVTFERLVK